MEQQQRKSRSSTRFRWRMRCTNTKKCGRRFTLKRHPDRYIQRWRVMCPSCGGHAYIDEYNRRRELEGRDQCHCNGIPFPHQRGSILGCDSHPKAPEDWTMEDEYQYQAMLETPRTGWG